MQWKGSFAHVIHYRNNREAYLTVCCDLSTARPLATSLGCNTEDSEPGQKAVVCCEVFSLTGQHYLAAFIL